MLSLRMILAAFRSSEAGMPARRSPPALAFLKTRQVGKLPQEGDEGHDARPDTGLASHPATSISIGALRSIATFSPPTALGI
jgi:hypothetical protein